MRFWVFTVMEDASTPELGRGWLRADTWQEALRMVGHDDAQVAEVPDDIGFPAQATGGIFWEFRAPSLAN